MSEGRAPDDRLHHGAVVGGGAGGPAGVASMGARGHGSVFCEHGRSIFLLRVSCSAPDPAPSNSSH